MALINEDVPSGKVVPRKFVRLSDVTLLLRLSDGKHLLHYLMVGLTEFESAISASQTQRLTTSLQPVKDSRFFRGSGNPLH